MSGGGLALSTLRSYQGAVALFVEYVTDLRNDWVAECERRFGPVPTSTRAPTHLDQHASANRRRSDGSERSFVDSPSRWLHPAAAGRLMRCGAALRSRERSLLGCMVVKMPYPRRDHAVITKSTSRGDTGRHDEGRLSRKILTGQRTGARRRRQGRRSARPPARTSQVRSARPARSTGTVRSSP
jgi:hypothetical protein